MFELVLSVRIVRALRVVCADLESKRDAPRGT